MNDDTTTTTTASAVIDPADFKALVDECYEHVGTIRDGAIGWLLNYHYKRSSGTYYAVYEQAHEDNVPAEEVARAMASARAAIDAWKRRQRVTKGVAPRFTTTR